MAQDKGLGFDQLKSNALLLCNTKPAEDLAKEV